MFKRGVLAAAALAVGLVAGCSYAAPKESDWEEAKVGMSQKQVVDILGQPYMAQGSQLPGVDEDLYLYSDTTNYEKGDRYAYYAIRFENGRIVEKHRYLTKRKPEEVLNEINRMRIRERQRQLQELQEAPTPAGGVGRTEPPPSRERPAGYGQDPTQPERGSQGVPLPRDLGDE